MIFWVIAFSLASLAAWLAGMMLLTMAKSAIHEIQAGMAWLIGTAFGIGAVLSYGLWSIRRAVVASSLKATVVAATPASGSGKWICPDCKTENAAKLRTCSNCRADRPTLV
jgi:hypothetical protein